VETPLLIPANAPEEYIDPVLALPLQLQTSPEICMKRLLCRGHKRLLQISHCWRSEERGSRHLSEFTMLEWYRAGSDYNVLMADCEDLLKHVAAACLTEFQVYSYKTLKIDPFKPWIRISVQEAFSQFSNTNVWECMKKGVYEEILTEKIEPALAGFSSPVFLTDYPAELAALSRLKQGQTELAERFELYLGGLELANGFSELNDPVEQRLRFEATNRLRLQDGRTALPLPERFLEELGKMPSSAGIAMGVDRLVMLAAGADSIDEVVAFTPEQL
jgi:lysyl-tRNA synthetase class 2